jgi:hypothetical protein
MQKRIEYIIVISLSLLILVLLVSAQISPGKLAEPHAFLEGLSNCTKCHVLGEKVTDEKCLDCHQEIATLISVQRGYHASAEAGAEDCINCHSDHHGRNFKMIRFDADEFDHALAGYDLHGAHAELSCRNCHTSEFIADPKIRAKSSTYLGLDQKCLSCHGDYHQGTLSSDCSSCHNFRVFRPASKFDHQKTRFRLRGKHTDVECIKCHKVSLRNGTEMQEYAGVAFGNCTACHRDVHDNKFGQNCVQCHTEESFLRIKQLNNFDHSQTHYPLMGKHQYVACASCHKSGYNQNIKYNRCTDCHADYHEKQFAVGGRSPDCSDCHSTLGFERSDFTIERHNQADFKLTGAHLATPCFACHKKSDKWSFREIGKTCMDCHENIHEPYLDKEYYEEATCESCHSSSRWSEIGFDHSNTDFKLEGAHLRQSCRSCHFKEDEAGAMVQEFSQLSSGCVSCHQDIHKGQFEDTGGTNCLECHGYEDWTAGRFDHDKTAFRLEGKHESVACYKCHKPVIEAGITYTEYKLKDYACESCH